MSWSFLFFWFLFVFVLRFSAVHSVKHRLTWWISLWHRVGKPPPSLVPSVKRTDPPWLFTHQLSFFMLWCWIITPWVTRPTADVHKSFDRDIWREVMHRETGRPFKSHQWQMKDTVAEDHICQFCAMDFSLLQNCRAVLNMDQTNISGSATSGRNFFHSCVTAKIKTWREPKRPWNVEGGRARRDMRQPPQLNLVTRRSGIFLTCQPSWCPHLRYCSAAQCWIVGS